MEMALLLEEEGGPDPDPPLDLGVQVGGKTVEISLPSGKIQNYKKITKTNSSTDSSERSIRVL